MLEKAIRDGLILWATIDPIGTMALFLALTAQVSADERRRIALRSVLYAATILVLCVIVGQLILDAMQISIASVQIAGSIILFLFGLQMVFGSVEQASQQPEQGHDLAVFPIAVPSIAGPGAIMSVIILTDNDQFSVGEQVLTAAILLGVLAVTYLLMRSANTLHRLLGKNGAAILTRIMGMLLAALAVEMFIRGAMLQIAGNTANNGQGP